MTSKKSIMTQVRQSLKERSAAYGQPADVLGKTAQLWSCYLQTIIEPHDVVAMLITMKLSSIGQNSSPERVHSVMSDIIGYSAILDSMMGYGKLPQPTEKDLTQFENDTDEQLTQTDDFLKHVNNIVGSARRQDYGDEQLSHAIIAKQWELLVNVPIRPIDVDALMIYYKVARISDSPIRRDTIVDIAGYALLADRQAGDDINAQLPPVPDTDQAPHE